MKKKIAAQSRAKPPFMPIISAPIVSGKGRYLVRSYSNPVQGRFAAEKPSHMGINSVKFDC